MLSVFRLILIAGLIAFLPSSLFSSTNSSSSHLSASSDLTQPLISQLGNMPLIFTENQGQWDEKVKFRANAGGATMWFASDGAYYQFTRTIESDASSAVDKRYGMPDYMTDRQPDAVETMMIEANFVGANRNPQMVGMEMIDYECNYFIGNDQSKWTTNVPNYTVVLYEQVYDGIDLKYYGNGKQMEYDFIVEPGADFSQIKIQYEGAESVSLNDNGELVVTTKWGEVVEQKPVIYQIENGSRLSVSGDYDIKGANAFGFKITGDFDGSLPLVIDPVLTYSTYLVGSIDERGFSIAVDSSGSAYVTGITYSTDFPTLNPYQIYQGNVDIFVTKLSSSGNSLIYSTYLSGTNYDLVYGIAVDASGAAYVTGWTESADFPIEDPYQGTFHGVSDAFITKLNSSGDSLIYSTYLGGSLSDYGASIAFDSSGSAYVTGYTASTDFPTLDPYQTDQLGVDVFVTKLSSSGNSLIYSTYLGGSGADEGTGIAVDYSGSACVTGITQSTNFPTLNQLRTDQGTTDAFVTKLSSSGNSLVYSTYLGGTYSDVGRGIAVDGSGSAYVTGTTFSANFPTLNPYQTYPGFTGYSDVFITKLSSLGNLLYSTYLGGSSQDQGWGIAVDSFGSAYVTGYTYSPASDFPLLDPYQGTYQGAGNDAFITKLSSSGSSLIYSTFLGGNYDDYGRSIAVDGSGSAYVTGYTNSSNFPILNGYQINHTLASNVVFVTQMSAPTACCGLYTSGQTGNTNCGTDGKRNLADITRLIDRVFLSKVPLCCEENGNTNGDVDAKLNLADITRLIDHIFLTKAETAACE